MNSPNLPAWLTESAATVTAAVVLSLALAAAAAWQQRAIEAGRGLQHQAAGRPRRRLSAGTLAAIAAFIICTSVSLNTSYRFTADGLGMTGEAERLLSCAAFESLMAMCVLGARERLAGDTRSPGWYGGAVWILAALSAVPAWHEGGGWTTGTVVRVIVGSFGSALAAHSALGLDLKHRTGGQSETPLAQILRDLRERLMAFLGLTTRNRSAKEIAADRAMDRAVKLRDQYNRLPEDKKKERKGSKLAARLADAQDRAGLIDPKRKQLYIDRVAQRQFATALDIPNERSPWAAAGTTPEAQAQEAAQTERLEALAEQVEAFIQAQGAQGTDDVQFLPQQRAEGTQEPAVVDFSDRLTDASADCITSAQVEEEAQETEAGRAAAAQGQAGPRVTVRVPEDDEPEPEHGQADEDQEDPAAGVDLDAYQLKKDKLLALYRVLISPDDPRPTNQIADELLRRLERCGITYDRAPANRAIDAVRPKATELPQAPARELQTA